jgi:hypothetical protein
MSKIAFFILFFSYLSIIYLIFFTDFRIILGLLVIYLFTGQNLIFNVTFLLTFIYQISLQFITKEKYLFSNLVLFIFLASIFIPLMYSLLFISELVKLGEYLSYPILANIIVTPLTYFMFYFKLEKGYLNPLRPILLFITCYIAVALAVAGYNFQKSNEINRLGLSILYIIVNSVPAIANIFSGSSIPESSLETLRNLLIFIPLPLIALFIVSTFIYLLFSLFKNIQYYFFNQFFAKNVHSNANFKYYLENMAKIVFISIFTVLIMLISIYLLFNLDYRFGLLFFLVPYLLILMTLFLVK